MSEIPTTEVDSTKEFDLLEKLNGENYLNWYSSIELWLLSQRYSDHFTKKASYIDAKLKDSWELIDYQLVSLLQNLLILTVFSLGLFTKSLQTLYHKLNPPIICVFDLCHRDSTKFYVGF